MATKKRAAAKKSGMCKKGLHKMTPANTYNHPAKGPECRACKRLYMKSYMRKRRAKGPATKARKAARKSAKRRR